LLHRIELERLGSNNRLNLLENYKKNANFSVMEKEEEKTTTNAVGGAFVNMEQRIKHMSTAVKISNLPKKITEGQIYELFSTCGIINRVIMEMMVPSNVSHTSCVVV
jgi:RNA recognition motif-containing protein